METVINQHGLDIEVLKSSRLPLTGGSQIGNYACLHISERMFVMVFQRFSCHCLVICAGSSSQTVGVANDSRVGLADNEMSKMDPLASGRPPIAPTGGPPDYYQGSVAQRSNQSFDQGSPSSLDSRSANSQSQDRRDTTNWDKQVNQKDGKKATTKRKRGDTSSPVELHVDSPQLDSRNTVVSARKGKLNKTEPSDGLPGKSGELTNFNMVPSSSQMEDFLTLSGSMRTILRTYQEVASAHIAPGRQHGGSLSSSHEFRSVWHQNNAGLTFEKSQVPRFSSNVIPGNMMAEILIQQLLTPTLGSSKGFGYFASIVHDII